MGIFDEVFSKVSETSKNVGESTKTKLQENKLKKEYKKLKEDMNQELRLLGAEVYDLLEKKEELGDFSERREKIRKLYNLQLQNREELNTLTKTMIRCPSCNKLFDNEDEYCPYCGKKRL